MKTIRTIVSAVALMAGVAMAQPALAQNARELAQAGSWTARVAISDRGAAMCVMSNVTRPFGVHIKYFRGTRHLVLHLFRDGWDIPRDVEVPLLIGVDGGNQWNARASSLGDGLEVTIPERMVQEFETALRNGEFLEIRFPNHREEGWRVRLSGLDTVAPAFADCMGAVNRFAGGQQQPQAPQQPVQTQPRVQPFEVAPSAGKPGRNT